MARAAPACSDRRMRRLLATAGTVLLLTLPLTGCGADDSGAKAGSSTSGSSASTAPSDLPTNLPTEIPSCLTSALPTELPTEVPSDLARCLPSNPATDLPTDLPSDVPTDEPTDVPTQAPGGVLDACAVVPAALIKADFGADAGQALGQPSSFGDPNAKDCYYVGGDVTFVIQATTRADQDLPESSYSYAGLPGADPVSGADRGWVYVFPGQDGGDSITSGVILVKGQVGMNFSITIEGHPYTNATLQTFAAHVLAAI
jgi:hypothetical protein